MTIEMGKEVYEDSSEELYFVQANKANTGTEHRLIAFKYINEINNEINI